MSDFKELSDLILKFREERNWKQFHKPKDMLVSLNLEAAELLELIQWKSDQEFLDQLDDLRKEVGEELSDILYWLLLIANDLDIDLKAAFLEKMKKNEAKYPVEKAKNSAAKYKEL